MPNFISIRARVSVGLKIYKSDQQNVQSSQNFQSLWTVTMMIDDSNKV